MSADACLVLCTALPEAIEPAALEAALRCRLARCRSAVGSMTHSSDLDRPGDRLLDAATLARIDRLHQPLDRLRSLLGRLLLRHGLMLLGADLGAGASLVAGPYGKPRLQHGGPEFNLSHAGRRVVCALSRAAVGIDVEQLRPCDLQLAWRYFHRRECEVLARQPVHAQADYFFHLWTAKEAYIKALGLGFQRDMASFCVVDGQGAIVLDDPQQPPQYSARPLQLTHLVLDPAYRLALCRTEPAVAVTHVSCDQLLMEPTSPH